MFESERDQLFCSPASVHPTGFRLRRSRFLLRRRTAGFWLRDAVSFSDPCPRLLTPRLASLVSTAVFHRGYPGFVWPTFLFFSFPIDSPSSASSVSSFLIKSRFIFRLTQIIKDVWFACRKIDGWGTIEDDWIFWKRWSVSDLTNREEGSVWASFFIGFSSADGGSPSPLLCSAGGRWLTLALTRVSGC